MASVAWQAPQQKPNKPVTIEQTPEGFSSLYHRLLKTGARPNQTLVVMEATGIYWMALATFLTRQGYGVSIVNPSQAHHFAKALLKRAKTDTIDAQTLAQLAALLQPALWVPPQRSMRSWSNDSPRETASCSCVVSCAINSTRSDTMSIPT